MAFNSSISLSELPTEILIKIFKYIPENDIEACRYLNYQFWRFFEMYFKSTKNCLDLTGLTIAKKEPIVQLFSKCMKNVKSLTLNNNPVIQNVDLFFTRLGLTVKELYLSKESLYAMSDRTLLTFVLRFSSVEKLQMENVFLLHRLMTLNLTWDSIKELELRSARNTFVLVSREVVKYNGDFSELPNLERISLRGLSAKNINFVTKFSTKIKSLENIDLFCMERATCEQLLKIQGLELLELELDFNHPIRQLQMNKFFQMQPSIKSLNVKVMSMDHKKWMPEIDYSKITKLCVQVLYEKLDVKIFKDLPNLQELHLLSADFDLEVESDERCFLSSHDVIVNNSVELLSLDPLLYNCCMQCLKVLLKSFKKITRFYVNAEPRCAYGFWLSLMVLIKDLELNLQLKELRMQTIRFPVFDIDQELDPDIIFGGIFPYFPKLTDLIIDYELAEFKTEHIKNVSKKCPALEKFGLTTPDLFNEFLIPAIIQMFPNLKHLQLEMGTLLDELLLNELLKSPMKLLTLRVCPTMWTEQMIYRLFEKCEYLRFVHTNRRNVYRSDYCKFIEDE